jgi:hypothetical protein
MCSAPIAVLPYWLASRRAKKITRRAFSVNRSNILPVPESMPRSLTGSIGVATGGPKHSSKARNRPLEPPGALLPPQFDVYLYITYLVLVLSSMSLPRASVYPVHLVFLSNFCFQRLAALFVFGKNSSLAESGACSLFGQNTRGWRINRNLFTQSAVCQGHAPLSAKPFRIRFYAKRTSKFFRIRFYEK